MLVENKKAVIFGGSGAIGRSIAKVLAREGAHLYLVARNHKKLEEAANEIRTIGKNVEIFCLDVLNEQTTIEQISLLSQKSNGIDIVINATGFMHEQGKEISELSLEEFMQGSLIYQKRYPRIWAVSVLEQLLILLLLQVQCRYQVILAILLDVLE